RRDHLRCRSHDRLRSGDRLARRRLRQRKRSPTRGHESGRARRAGGPRSRRAVGSRRHRRARAHGRPAARQPAGAAQARGAADHSGGLMAGSVSTTDIKSDMRGPDALTPPRRRPRKKASPHRWVREVQGIAALTAGVFLLVALAVFDPTIPPAEQTTMVGPVGIWIAWSFFRAFGYAAFLFPLAAGVWGAAAFVRPLATRGWVPMAGLLLLLLAATGLLQQSTDSRAAARVTRGGVVQAGGFT